MRNSKKSYFAIFTQLFFIASIIHLLSLTFPSHFCSIRVHSEIQGLFLTHTIIKPFFIPSEHG